MGIKQKIVEGAKKLIGVAGDEPRNYEELAITGYGIRVVTDGKLERRLTRYTEGLLGISEDVDRSDHQVWLEQLKMQLNKINETVQLVAGVYARAGENPSYYRKMKGWDRLYANAVNRCVRAERIVKNLDSDVEYSGDVAVLLHNLEQSIWNFVYPAALNIVNFCFRNKDISERTVAMLQILPQQGQYYPPTTLDVPASATKELAKIRTVQNWGQPRGIPENTESKKYGGAKHADNNA